MSSSKKLNLEELKVLVFEKNQATKQNKDKLFKLAKASKDIECIKKLRDDFSFKNAKVYLEKLNTISLEKVLITRDIDMLHLLIQQGINISEINIINLIQSSYSLEFIRTLIDAGANINIIDQYGNTPLMIASNKGKYDVVKLLVEKKAKLDLQNYHGYTAITMAFTRKEIYYSIIKHLIDSGADANKTIKKYKSTALMSACIENDEKVALLLVNHTKDLDAQSNDGDSPLLDAVNNNMINVVELLLKKKANVNIQNITNGITPLMIACANENEKMINLLLNYKPDLYILDNNDLSATDYAAGALNYNILKLLLDNGARKIKVDKLDKNDSMDDKIFKKRAKFAATIPSIASKIKKIILSKDIAEEFIAWQFFVLRETMGSNPYVLEHENHIAYLKNKLPKEEDSPAIKAIDLFLSIIDSIDAEAKYYTITSILDIIMQDYSIGMYSSDLYDEIEYDKYGNNYKYKLVLENQIDGKAFIDVYDYKIIFHFLNNFNERSSSEYKLISKNKYHDERRGYILLIDNYVIEKTPNGRRRVSTCIMKDEFDNIMSFSQHNPQKLVKLLTNFRKDTPIKYTTHIWDMSFKEDYGDFKTYLLRVTEQWNEIEEQLKELSPRLYEKIYNFLLNKDVDSKSWCSKDGDALNIGWSSLEGLEEWCNKGNDPFNFKLTTSYKINNSTITTFGEVITLFKQEIQIRNENNMLENIFIDIEEQLDEQYDGLFEFELVNLKGKTFYTDTEIFRNLLVDRIFKDITKEERHQYNKIKVEIGPNNSLDYHELRIIQIGSQSNQSSHDMLNHHGADTSIIKEGLTNLCDWSIESSSATENYRINYLKSDATLDDIEPLDYKPEGYTHIMRFYK